MIDGRIVTATIPTVVELEPWQCRLYGQRWTLSFEGRPLVTRATEAGARAYATRSHWRVGVADRTTPSERWGP